jgi:predicted phage-related endonuclease
LLANPITLERVKDVTKLEGMRKELIEEAKAEADSLRDEIKAEMLNRDTEELTAGQYIVRYTTVLSNRFDSTAFKKIMPEIYKAYTKQVSSRRFSIN